MPQCHEWTTVRLSRFAATAVVVVLSTASGLMLAAPAAAAPPAGVGYVDATDVAFLAPFSNNGWGQSSSVTLSSGLAGMTMPYTTALQYGFTTTVPTVSGSALRGIGNASSFSVSDATDVYAEITWYDNAAGEWYLAAVLPGSAAFTDPSAQWWSASAVGTIGPFVPATLDQFDAEFASDPAVSGASVKGVGLYNDGPTVTMTSFSANGTTSYFTPVPVSTAVASIGQVDFGTAGSGFTATTSGFVPGETVSVYLNTTQSTSDPIDIVADPSGTVTYTWVAPVTDMEVGTYAINFSTQFTSGLLQTFQFDVTAQALAIAALPNAGTDTALPAALGGILLVGGAIIAATARRRRSA